MKDIIEISLILFGPLFLWSMYGLAYGIYHFTSPKVLVVLPAWYVVKLGPVWWILYLIVHHRIEKNGGFISTNFAKCHMCGSLYYRYFCTDIYCSWVCSKLAALQEYSKTKE